MASVWKQTFISIGRPDNLCVVVGGSGGITKCFAHRHIHVSGHLSLNQLLEQYTTPRSKLN